MDTYLVLHIDLEFIAAAICKSNGSHFSIKNLNEELLWLYFFNDPNLNRITYGKANKQHFHNLEVNYHGDFCNQILDENEKFTRNGIQKPVIELLENSGMLRLFSEKFKERAPFAQTESIPTLITFSSTLKTISISFGSRIPVANSLILAVIFCMLSFIGLILQTISSIASIIRWLLSLILLI